MALVHAREAGYTHRLVTPGWNSLMFKSEKAAHDALIGLSKHGDADWSKSYVEQIPEFVPFQECYGKAWCHPKRHGHTREQPPQKDEAERLDECVICERPMPPAHFCTPPQTTGGSEPK